MTTDQAITVAGKAYWIGDYTIAVVGIQTSFMMSSHGQELARLYREHKDRYSHFLLVLKDRLEEIRQQDGEINISLRQDEFTSFEQLQEMNKAIAYKLMAGRISIEIAPIIISYVASLPQIQSWIKHSQWLNEVNTPQERHRQRLLGSAIGYRRFLIESCIIGLAKTIESSFLIINHETGTNFNKVYDSYFDNLLHVEDARMIYRCNNVIKHHQSIIPSISNSNGKYLIEHHNYKEGDNISHLHIDIPKQFCNTYSFLLDLLRKITDISDPVLRLAEEERQVEIIKRFAG